MGLLAGDLILLFFLLQHALHATILAGEPARTLPDAVRDLHPLCDLLICRLDARRPARNPAVPCTLDHTLVVAASFDCGRWSGPIALLVIFALLSRSHIYFRNFAEICTLFAYTILVSTVSFMVYLALLRKEMKSNPTRSQHFFHRA